MTVERDQKLKSQRFFTEVLKGRWTALHTNGHVTDHRQDVLVVSAGQSRLGFEWCIAFRREAWRDLAAYLGRGVGARGIRSLFELITEFGNEISISKQFGAPSLNPDTREIGNFFLKFCNVIAHVFEVEFDIIERSLNFIAHLRSITIGCVYREDQLPGGNKGKRRAHPKR